MSSSTALAPPLGELSAQPTERENRRSAACGRQTLRGIRDGRCAVRGWLNIARWNGALACADGKTVTFTTPPAGDRLHRRWHCLPLTAENAAAIPCRQVLGVYSVSFPRQD